MPDPSLDVATTAETQQIDARPATGEQRDDARIVGDVRTKLRVGLMLDSWTVPAWTASIIRQIQESDFAEIALVVMQDSVETPRWQRLKRLLPQILYSLYLRLDRWLINRVIHVGNDAFDRTNIKQDVAAAPTMKLTPIQKGFSQRFAADDVDRIQSAKLDVMLRFGFGIIRGDILHVARYGVWSFHHGDNREYRGGPPMFWEMYEGNPVAGVTLQILSDKLDGGKVIYRSLSKTNSFSLHLNRNKNYWKGSDFVLRRLRDVHRAGTEALTTLETYQEHIDYQRGIYRTPGNFTMLRFLARLALRTAGRAWQDFTTEEKWFVAWRRRSTNHAVASVSSAKGFQFLWPPRGRFYADPFLIKHANRNYIFFEDYSYREKRAVISFVELGSDGSASTPQVAIRADHHLSYPFVFEHAGQIYMLPESREVRRIELWRATRFPDAWQLDRVLFDGINAGDPTWLAYGNRFWLFMNLAVEGAASSDELHCFHSSQPFGPWESHALNPIVSDVRLARPAGRVFMQDGHLVRPAQDCALVYGHRVVLRQIDVLTPTGYREHTIGTIEPEWLQGNVGTHTFDLNEDFEIVDGRVRASRLPLGRQPAERS